MKTLLSLNDKPSLIEDITDEKLLSGIPTYRTLYKMAVGNCQAKDGNEAIDLVQIGLKLKIDTATVGFEDAEFKLLKTKVEGNEAKLLANFHGQLLIKLKESEK